MVGDCWFMFIWKLFCGVVIVVFWRIGVVMVFLSVGLFSVCVWKCCCVEFGVG